MVLLENNFDFGPDGTTITSANSANGGDAFDVVVSTGTGAVLRYVPAVERATAEFVMETSTGATATTPYVAWTTSMGAQATIYTRWYARFSAVPTSGNNDNVLFMIWSGATHCCSVWVNNSANIGTPLILPSATASTHMASVITAGEWNRFEFKAVMSTTVGAGELRLYAHPNEDAPVGDYDEVLIQTGKNYGASTGSSFRLGCANPLSNQTATTHSNWGMSTVDWLGPAPWRAGKGVPGILTNPIAIHTDSW